MFRRPAIHTAAATLAAVTAAVLPSAPAAAGSSETSAAFSCASLGKPPADPTKYAARVVTAWNSGNRAVADCYAIPQVSALLFGESAKSSATWRFVGQGGGPDEDFRVVVFRNRAGAELQLFVRLFSGSNTWDRTFQVLLSDGNGRVSTYADKLIRAWGRGDRAAALRFGTPTAVNALWDFSQGPGGTCWARTWTGAHAYATTVDYQCGTDFVTLTIKPRAASAGKPQAVTGAVVLDL